MPALFIEGVALASRFYPELGLRPTSFIDVLVNGHDCQAARTRLADLGWKTAQGTDPRVPGGPRHLVDQHGNVCVLRSTIAIDLITEAREPFDPIWDTWHRLALFGADVCGPPPTETLFAVVISNARWKSRKSLQWIVDVRQSSEPGSIGTACSSSGKQPARFSGSARRASTLPLARCQASS